MSLIIVVIYIEEKYQFSFFFFVLIDRSIYTLSKNPMTNMKWLTDSEVLNNLSSRRINLNKDLKNLRYMNFVHFIYLFFFKFVHISPHLITILSTILIYLILLNITITVFFFNVKTWITISRFNKSICSSNTLGS